MLYNVIVISLIIALLTLRIMAFVHKHKKSDKMSKVLDMAIIILAFGLQIIKPLLDSIAVM